MSRYATSARAATQACRRLRAAAARCGAARSRCAATPDAARVTLARGKARMCRDAMLMRLHDVIAMMLTMPDEDYVFAAMPRRRAVCRCRPHGRVKTMFCWLATAMPYCSSAVHC